MSRVAPHYEFHKHLDVYSGDTYFKGMNGAEFRSKVSSGHQLIHKRVLAGVLGDARLKRVR